MKRKFNHPLLHLLFIGLFLSLGAAMLSGCAEETSKNPTGEIIGKKDDNQNQEEEEEEEEEELYTRGVLDGVWELSWAQSEEHFSTFTIIHDLDEDRLAVSFESFIEDEEVEQSGELSVVNWRDDKFTGEWKPYPVTDPAENYRIVQSSFVQDQDDEIKGLIAGMTFDFRDFVMVKKVD